MPVSGLQDREHLELMELPEWALRPKRERATAIRSTLRTADLVRNKQAADDLKRRADSINRKSVLRRPEATASLLDAEGRRFVQFCIIVFVVVFCPPELQELSEHQIPHRLKCYVEP
jgi:hypothetical protein